MGLLSALAAAALLATATAGSVAPRAPLALPQRVGVARSRTNARSRVPAAISLANDGPEPWIASLTSAMAGTYYRLTDFRVARASHILLKGYDEGTVQQMLSWKEEISDDPEKFAEVATQYSLCPSRRKGGDLGFFTRGKMVKEFDTVVFTEKPGAVYGPVRSDFGHHLIFIHSCRQP